MAKKLIYCSLLPYISYQSTLGYLKNPPKGYLIPGVDVIGGFQEMRQKLMNGGYTNQYEFVEDIANIVSSLLPHPLSVTQHTVEAKSGN